MSKVTRRKHVLKEMMEDNFDLPEAQQKIVRVVSSRGNNLHAVESADAENFLVSMPNKFRKNIWIKRGDFVLVDPIEEGAKVKGEICKILTPEHIKVYTKAGVWPENFAKTRNDNELGETVDEFSGSDEDTGFIVKNMNRPPVQYVEESDDTSDSDTDESNEDDSVSNK